MKECVCQVSSTMPAFKWVVNKLWSLFSCDNCDDGDRDKVLKIGRSVREGEDRVEGKGERQEGRVSTEKVLSPFSE